MAEGLILAVGLWSILQNLVILLSHYLKSSIEISSRVVFNGWTN